MRELGRELLLRVGMAACAAMLAVMAVGAILWWAPMVACTVGR